MKLLFLNSIKGLRYKKVQMLSIAALLLLSSVIYTSLMTSFNRVENRYYKYLEEQQVEHFSFKPNIKYGEEINFDKIDLEKYNLTNEELSIITEYQKCVKVACTEESYLNFLNVLNNHQIAFDLKIDEVSKISDKYDFEYELQKNKISSIDKKYIKAIPYNKDSEINKMHLVEGSYPINNNEITLLPKFAENHNLKIGDNYKVGDNNYKIVGFSFASDHIYPLVDISSPIFDDSKNNIIFMNEQTYNDFKGIEEVFYAARFKADYSFKDRMVVRVGPGNSEAKKENVLESITKEEDISFDMTSMLRILRTDAIQMDIEPNKTFTEALLYLLLSVAAIVIIIIVKKRVDAERMQIGILKALGYNSVTISLSYLVYPIVGVLSGVIIGYLIGLLLVPMLSAIYVKYYTIPLANIVIDYTILSKLIIIPLIVLSVVTFITSLLMVKKKPLDLIKEGSNLKVNFLNRIVSLITKKMPFKNRFKYSLAFRSIGKLLIVSIVSFVTGLLIVLTLIGMNLFDNLLSQTFDSMKYKYVVNYNTFQFDTDQEEDLILKIEQPIHELLNSNNEKLKLESTDNVQVLGIDKNIKYVTVVAEKIKIENILTENNIIISPVLAEKNNLKENDYIVLKISNEEVKFKIVHINEEFMSSTIYIDREEMSKLYGFPTSVYNLKYSISDKYSDFSKVDNEEALAIASIFNLEDLKSNIYNQIKVFDTVVYVIIIFASLMALIIIGVIASIVVEENKKTISLMKVLGYKNKEISSVVLNIYTPFIIISYLLSVPAMINIVKSILKLISGDIGIVIPIKVSYLNVGLGLFGLLVAYYIAVKVARKTLNKIPLAIALKRE